MVQCVLYLVHTLCSGHHCNCKCCVLCTRKQHNTAVLHHSMCSVCSSYNGSCHLEYYSLSNCLEFSVAHNVYHLIGMVIPLCVRMCLGASKAWEYSVS